MSSITSYFKLRWNRQKVAAVVVAFLLLVLYAFGIYRVVLFPNPKAHSLIFIYGFFATFFLAAFAVVTFLMLKNKLKIEYIFLISMLSIGIVYMFLMTPNCIPDEPVHFDTAYRYSNVLLGEKYSMGTPQGPFVGMVKRADDIKILSKFTQTPNINEYHLIASQLFTKESNTTLVPTKGYNVSLVGIDYLPAALGFTLARILDLSAVALYMLGRLFNLLFFTICVFVAIRKVPFGKMIFFAVALLPMTVHQAASLSYDSIVMGLSFLFIGYCLYVAFGNQKLRYRELIVLGIMSALLAPSKIVYVFVCLLCLLIPKEKFENLKFPIDKKIVYVLFLLLLSVASFLVFNQAVIGNSLSVSGQLTYTSTPAYTISFLMDHPLKIASLIFFTMRDELSFYWGTMLGNRLGILTINVPSIYIDAFLIILILSVFKNENENVGLKSRDRWVIGSIICLVFASTCAVMLLAWTPVTYRAVEGVQGRYFLPILPLALLFFRNNRMVLKGRIDHILAYSIWFVQILTVASVFQTLVAG